MSEARRRVLLTGATGFVGGHVSRELAAAGIEVVPVSRRPGAAVDWSEESLRRGVQETDGVIHLAGESVFGRWTGRRRRAIRESRVETTGRLARLLAEKGSGVLVSTSAVGFYGDTGTATIDEDAPQGAGFLAEVCGAWEEATAPAREAGLRVAIVRTGVVLGRDGGALQRMWLPFLLGLGGPIGHGRQPFPWIHTGDLAALYRFLLTTEDASGVFNGTAPEAVDSRGFARTLGRVLGRPAVLPAPAFVLRLVLGEMSSMLLTGQSARPRRALDAGYAFRFPELEAALRDLKQGGS